MAESIRLAGELWTAGYTSTDVARLVRAGELVRIRRGAYGFPSEAAAPDPRVDHRRLIAATLPRCSPEVVLSDMSATVVHDLPVWTEELTRVHLTRDRSGGSKLSTSAQVRGLVLPADDVVRVEGLAVTSLARTVLDLACRLPLDRAVAIGDAALRKGLTPEELAVTAARAGRRVGASAARRAIALLDGRSESVGESQSRVIFHQYGLPAPEPQYEVFDARGRFVARCDFGWPRLRTVGEFDGRIKYQPKLRPGHDPAEELFREKRREDALRDLDLRVVRWVTADLFPPTQLIARLNRAFAYATRA